MRRRAVNQQIAEETVELRLFSHLLAGKPLVRHHVLDCAGLPGTPLALTWKLTYGHSWLVAGRQERLDSAGLFSDVGGRRVEAFLFPGASKRRAVLAMEPVSVCCGILIFSV